MSTEFIVGKKQTRMEQRDFIVQIEKLLNVQQMLKLATNTLFPKLVIIFATNQIKIQHKDSSNLSEYLSSLWNFIDYPYEYWHDYFTTELDSIYFEDEELEPELDEQLPPSPVFAQQPPSPVYAISNVVNLISESNALIYDDVVAESNNVVAGSHYHETNVVSFDVINEAQVQPTTSRGIRLADIIDEINDVEGDSFDYMESITNREGTNLIYAERRAELEEKEREIQRRIEAITNEEIENEIRQVWVLKGVAESRKQFCKKERTQARKDIIKRIERDEKNNVHHRFLERNKDVRNKK